MRMNAHPPTLSRELASHGLGPGHDPHGRFPPAIAGPTVVGAPRPHAEGVPGPSTREEPGPSPSGSARDPAPGPEAKETLVRTIGKDGPRREREARPKSPAILDRTSCSYRLPHGHAPMPSPTPQHFVLRYSPEVRRQSGMSTRPAGHALARSKVVQRWQTVRSRARSRKKLTFANGTLSEP